MTYEQEKHAKELYTELTMALSSGHSDTEVEISGKGVHWNCMVRRGNRDCKIHCFHGPEYLAYFNQESQTIAIGRTSSKDDACASARNWLDNDTLEDLYTRFDFIDQAKRRLKAIELELTTTCPELKQCEINLDNFENSDFYKLWLRKNDRACQISSYAKNVFPTTVFYWDDAQLFRLQTGNVQELAIVIKRWVLDYKMPSDLEQEFSRIDVGKLSRYYEEGRGIEGEFILSWDFIEGFYETTGLPYKQEILELIAEMRTQGYEKTLRAGQSLYWMILSRSRRHGLRRGQPSIVLNFSEREMVVNARFDENREISFESIEFTPRLDELLKQLESKKID